MEWAYMWLWLSFPPNLSVSYPPYLSVSFSLSLTISVSLSLTISLSLFPSLSLRLSFPPYLSVSLSLPICLSLYGFMSTPAEGNRNTFVFCSLGVWGASAPQTWEIQWNTGISNSSGIGIVFEISVIRLDRASPIYKEIELKKSREVKTLK